jgi:multidrug efflux pump subunit AcrA (membrane-fusion protein)
MRTAQILIPSSLQHWAKSWIGLALLLAAAVGSPPGAAADSNVLPPSITTAPLSVEEVVNNLTRHDEMRAQALRHYESTRVYRLSYHGFPGDRGAEMTVKAIYDSPSKKSFKVVSENGSKLIIDRVFKRLLESEKEALQPEMHSRTLLNRENYDIALIAFEPSDKGGQYVLAVSPKAKSKYVYRGKVWVDGADFAVTRIDAEPAQNPSFWTKRSEIHHEYVKVQDFWLPRRNESVSYVRLGGRATLTIEYNNYQVNDSRGAGNAATR